ncbi:MAG: hypothetical protein C0625_09345 [Arcobacter sp.]|nr:MAG: hypothetical protein C0625_09345 [Arcobacter sp.]
MKYILAIFSFILFFTGCENKQVKVPEVKTYYSIDKFNYSKENIAFFEEKFNEILQIDNPIILNEYSNFYKKNSNYFINGKQKVKTIEKRLKELRKTAKVNEELQLLEKAKKADKKEAIKIYKELAKKNNIKAQRELVKIYKYENPSESLYWLEKLVLAEDIYSMKEYASANIYMVRPIIVQDLKRALNIYNKLADMGELSSIMRLGNIYEYGYHKDVAPQDKEKALKYYELAASKDYEIAQRKLYEIYSCEKCKPNRYNPEKAKVLQKKLISKLDKKILQGVEKRQKLLSKKLNHQKISKVKTVKAEIPKKIVPKIGKIEKPIIKETIVKNAKTELPKKIIPKIEKVNEKKVKKTNEAKEIVQKQIQKKEVEKVKIDKVQTVKVEDKKEKNIGVMPKLAITKKAKETIKCYDTEVAKIKQTAKCENKIKDILENNSEISRINIIPVIDKNDIAYFKDNKESLNSLGKDRALQVAEYLKKTIKGNPSINISTYYVISKKTNKGVIIKLH